MKLEQMVYAPMAAKQFTHRFNIENGTKISTSSDVRDGTPFVLFNFRDTSPELVFKYAYRLGNIQTYLENKREALLSVVDYPMPKKGDYAYEG